MTQMTLYRKVVKKALAIVFFAAQASESSAAVPFWPPQENLTSS